MTKQKIRINLFVLAVLASTVFLIPRIVFATESRSPEVKVYSTDDYSEDKAFMAYDESFQGGASVAVGDVRGDKEEEIIVAPGVGGGPHVKIFDSNGNMIFSFLAYDAEYKKGINITTGDLDGNGKDEIIVGTRSGATPHVRVFDGNGNPKFTMGFFAYKGDFRGGVNVTTCDVDGDGDKEIVTGAGPGGGPHARVFEKDGAFTGMDFFPFTADYRGGLSVACGNVDGGAKEELIFGVQSSDDAWVKVYKMNDNKTVIGNFKAFPETFKRGINLASGDVDGDGFDEVIAAANTGGGSHVRIYEAYGAPHSDSIFAYEDEFRGGVFVAAGDLNNDLSDEIIVAPSKRSTEGRTDIEKYIEIDISEQTLKYYERGYLVDTAVVSTGKWSMPTPLGTFKIQNKNRRAYSGKYNLYMPFWMQFDARGYGLHELPEWANGYKEGQNHLGIRVSHGCVRLGVGPAEKLYNWADVGTTVVVKD
ncbi:MAG: L,D-transpeptidase family protein [Patescibacteria group bacterium]